MEFQSCFDIIGPIMVGPSSSHTAGVVSIGKFIYELLGDCPQEVKIVFYDSLLWKFRLCMEQNLLRRLDRICSPGRIRQRNHPLSFIVRLNLSETFGDFLHEFPLRESVINGEPGRQNFGGSSVKRINFVQFI